MKTEMNYNSYGTMYKLTFERTQYMVDDSLAIQVWCEEPGDDYPEPFCTLTVNLGGTSSENAAYIDTNNVPGDLIQTLLAEGVMEMTGGIRTSGFCVYPEAEFNEEWLNAIG